MRGWESSPLAPCILGFPGLGVRPSVHSLPQPVGCAARVAGFVCCENKEWAGAMRAVSQHGPTAWCPFGVQVDLAMTAQPARPLGPDDGRAGGLAEVQHVIAVSSCKGGAPPALAAFVYSLCR